MTATPVAEPRHVVPAATVSTMPPADSPAGSPYRPRPVVAASLVLAVLPLLAGAAALRVNTAGGTIVLEFPQGLPPDADVLVDGERVVLRGIGADQAEITVQAGERQVEVKAGDEVVRKAKVTIYGGRRPVLRVSLAPEPAGRARRPDAGGRPKDDADDAVGPIASLPGHTGAVMCIAFSPDGRLAATHGGLGDHSFHVWDIGRRRQLYRLPDEECGGYGVVWTPDGRSVLSGGDGGRGSGAVLLRNVRTGKRVGSLLSHDRPVRGVAVSADGKHLASADGQGSVRIWDFKTGAKLHEFEHGTASFSPQGDSDGTVRVWDVATGKEVAKLAVGDEGHRLQCSAFSPDGRRALTGHADGSIGLWSLADGKKLAGFAKHKAAVQSVAFSPDGTLALSGENYQTQSDLWLYRLPRP